MLLKCFELLLLVSLSFAQHRKLSIFINPGCSSGCKDTENPLVHVTADGPNDTLHHVWDFTYRPTVLLGLTPPNTNLSIDWTKFKKGEVGAVKFSSPPLSVFSFVIDQLIEFNDRNNSASYDPAKFNASDATIYDIHNFHWEVVTNKLKNATDLATIVMEGKYHHGHRKTKGTVTVTLSAFGNLDHSEVQPHLLHTVNASQVDVVLNGLTTTESFKSRFALGFTIVTLDSSDSAIHLSERKTLDDEHSPGVFKIGEVKTESGYLMWRSVAYTSGDRNMGSSTVVNPGLFIPQNNSMVNRTVISALFGKTLENMLVRKSVFSFGQPGGEDFYPVSRYLSWTFLGGTGAPVNDSVSGFMELLTIFGIGLPAVVILIGLICIFVKRLSKQSHDIVFAEN